MIQKRDEFEGNILFFVASGVVTSGDYETAFIPEIEKTLGTHKRSREGILIVNCSAGTVNHALQDWIAQCLCGKVLFVY